MKYLLAKTKWQQFIGLMFMARKKDMMFVFPVEKKVKIHTWFMLYPIDILLCDKEGKVVEIKHNMKPFKYWESTEKAKYLIELGLNRIKEGDASGNVDI